MISRKCEFQLIKSLEITLTITLTINLRLTIFCEIDPWHITLHDTICACYTTFVKNYPLLMSTMNSKTFSSVIADGQSEDIIWNIANVCVLQIPINYFVY